MLEAQQQRDKPSIFSVSSLKHTCTRDGKDSIFEGLDCIIAPTSAHAAVADMKLASYDVDKLATRAVEKVRERIKETEDCLREQARKNEDGYKDGDDEQLDGEGEKKRVWRFVDYGLTEAEAASVFMYTAETPFYRVLNTCCRNANRRRVADFFPFLALFTQALKKIPCRRGTFWRAIKGDFAHQYKNQSKAVWWSFTSCTANISVIKKFNKQTDPKIKSRSVMFSIQDAYGADLSEFSWGRLSEEVSCAHLLAFCPCLRLRLYLKQANKTHTCARLHSCHHPATNTHTTLLNTGNSDPTRSGVPSEQHIAR